MDLPPWYAEEAIARLQWDWPRAKLERIATALGLDITEPGPEPDYEGLGGYKACDSVKVSEDFVTFSADLTVFGERKPIHFRYVYKGEFGYDDDFDGFAQIGVMAHLDVLTWDTDARSPYWSRVSIGVLSREMVQQIDNLVLAHEKAKFKNET